MALNWNIFKARKTTDNTPYKNVDRLIPLKLSQWDWLSDFTTELSLDDYRKIKNSNPIIRKGFSKKSRDLIFDGFHLDSPVDGEDIPEDIENTLTTFLKEKQITYKMHKAIYDSLWSGKNGWIEWVCQGNKYPDQPLNGKLTDVSYVATGSITGGKYNEEKTMVEYWKLARPITYDGKKYKYIHSSRLEPIGFYYDGDNPFSTSIIESARQAIKADNDATKYLGDNIILFSKPWISINTADNTNRKAVDDAYSYLQKVARKDIKFGYAGFKDTQFNVHNPDAPNPEASLYHFYVELAAALEMPLMFLIGEQKGHLTGSEVELADYYKSIRAIQEIHLSPIYHKMFQMLIGDSWRYEIYWNPLYVDEKTEVENKTKLMKEIGELYSKHGIVDVIEARQLLREWDINIPEQGELDEPENDEGDEEPEDEEDNLPPPNGIRPPTEAELEIARHMRERGKKELIEQEKRLRNANRPHKDNNA